MSETPQQAYMQKCKKAAEKGNVIAQNTLAYLYLHGRGVEQNDQQAAKWFRRAADQDYASAQYNLAVLYKLGQGVEKSAAESIKWIQAAANQNHAEAQSNIGNMFYQGLGITQDYEMAYMWWSLAEKNGIQNLTNNKNELSKKMNQTQISNAQQMITAWQVKH